MYLVLFALCFMSRTYLCSAATRKCRPVERPVLAHALINHVFQTSVLQELSECETICDNMAVCQSFNYYMPGKICELNNRTKEAWPDDFVPDVERFYKKKWPKRVRLGSIQQLPAHSCSEINASEQGYAVSGIYWLTANGGAAYQAYCDMTRGSKGWTLIARFANTDILTWMDDSGYWWYDKTDGPAGDSTNPSTNADMISPAFWLASGNELKITRNDDSQHTALLQTTGDCLGGQTFRSKITGYGDFRNGTAYVVRTCMGNCVVKYGGQYKETKGFEMTSCNDTLQNYNHIGFWCTYGFSGSVVMIGGGGRDCSHASHGVGITSSYSSYLLAETGRTEKDFGVTPWGPAEMAYALNLWVRG